MTKKAFSAIIIPSCPGPAVRRQNMKVRINATGDTIVMKFVRPNTDTKLEGYILGYGSSMFSKQFIPLPENGKPYETEFGEGCHKLALIYWFHNKIVDAFSPY